VILGGVVKRSITAHNAGSSALSFVVDQLQAPAVGFTVQLDSVSQLPANDTVEIPVNFDPRLANLDLGRTEETIVINVRIDVAFFSCHKSVKIFAVKCMQKMHKQCIVHCTVNYTASEMTQTVSRTHSLADCRFREHRCIFSGSHKRRLFTAIPALSLQL